MNDANAEGVGFIGLGIMGKPMAMHLHAAHRDLIVLDKSATVLEEMKAHGIRVAASCAEVGKRATIIVLMLPDAETVKDVLFGTDGLSRSVDRRSLIVDMGTTGVTATREIASQLAASGVEFIDAPVSGGQLGAHNATLTIMAGGAAGSFDRARPVFETLGSHATLVGAVGAGQAAKSANQIIVGVTVEAVAEAFILARSAGVDVEKLLAALTGGSADSPILQKHGRHMMEGKFTPGGRILTTAKDLEYAVDLARSLGLNLPLLQLACEHWTDARDEGLAELDQSAMIRYLEPYWVTD